MDAIKKSVAKVTNNPLGSLIGAGAGYMVAKKFGKVEKWYYLAGAVLVGAVVGGMAQSYMKAKASTPKATDVKK